MGEKNMKPKVKLGMKLRTTREGVGLSQYALGKEIGVEPNVIGNYERGFNYPPKTKLRALAKALGISFGDLFDLVIDAYGEELLQLNRKDKYGAA
jgi:transcriptional regulator with XRE-family HTH domain